MLICPFSRMPDCLKCQYNDSGKDLIFPCDSFPCGRKFCIRIQCRSGCLACEDCEDIPNED